MKTDKEATLYAAKSEKQSIAFKKVCFRSSYKSLRFRQGRQYYGS